MMGLAYAQRGFGHRPLMFGGIGAALGFLLFLGFVALVIFLLVSASRRYHAAPVAAMPRPDAAIQIARDRLARGEIDADQYTRIVASLTGAALPPNPT